MPKWQKWMNKKAKVAYKLEESYACDRDYDYGHVHYDRVHDGGDRVGCYGDHVQNDHDYGYGRGVDESVLHNYDREVSGRVDELSDRYDSEHFLVPGDGDLLEHMD